MQEVCVGMYFYICGGTKVFLKNNLADTAAAAAVQTYDYHNNMCKIISTLLFQINLNNIYKQITLFYI